MNSPGEIGYFAERINDMGVPRDHILVATHDTPDGDMRVEINYVSYQARTDSLRRLVRGSRLHRSTTARRRISAAPCSRTSPPRWPIPATCWARARWMTATPTRRATVMGNYEKGKVTSADKRKTDLPTNSPARLPM